MPLFSINVFGLSSVSINGATPANQFSPVANGSTIQLNSAGLTQMQVTDDDSDLDGDSVRDERSNDPFQSTTNILGTTDKVYGDFGYTVTDAAGNTYKIYVLDVRESPNGNLASNRAVSFFAYDNTNPPPFNQPLTVVNTFNLKDVPYASLVCFTTGTMIRTPLGDVPVESLKAGDLVMTLDHGARPVRWVGSKALSVLDLVLRPQHVPVTVRAGAFGRGLPVRDTAFSPQHRILVAGADVELMFGETEALASAKSLIDGVSVLQEGPRDVAYHHILLDSHEILFANGLPAESLLIGPESKRSLEAGEMGEEATLLDLSSLPETGPQHAARPILRPYEGRAIARRLFGMKVGEPA